LLSFFRINDPYRLVGVLILLLLIRLVFFWLGVPTIIPEIKWLTIGEKLTEGGVMYQSVWDNTAPLAALVYKWIFVLFGKTTTPYRVISIILVIIQAGIFNAMFLKNKAYNSNTYVPALIYVLFMNISFDFFTLPPILMAMTFILLAMNNLFKRMDNQTKDEIFILIGVYIGLATLFFLPSIFYFLVTLISILIYTSSIFRRIMLMIYGFAIVILLACIYYYWYDGLTIFITQFFGSAFILETYYFVAFTDFIILSTIPISIFIVAYYKMNINGRFINFQMKIQRVMLFYLLSGFLAMFMIKDFTTFQLIYFIPSVAFFVAHYLLTIRNWLKAEASILFIFTLIIVSCIFPLKGFLYTDKFASYDELIVNPSPIDLLVSDKKVLVIGNNISTYSNSRLATPYLNSQYAVYHLSNPNYYDNLTSIFRNFSADMPEVIIDEIGLVPMLFMNMPTIASQYDKKENSIYILKP
jgi:hypothetical protein